MLEDKKMYSLKDKLRETGLNVQKRRRKKKERRERRGTRNKSRTKY